MLMAVCRGGETVSTTQAEGLLRPLRYTRSDEKRQVKSVSRQRAISYQRLLRNGGKWRRMAGRMIYLLTYLLTHLPTYLLVRSFACLFIHLVIYLCIYVLCM